MRKLAIRFSVLTIGAAALMVAVVPAEAKTQHHRHWRHHAGGAWYGYGYPAQPMTRSYSQSGSSWVCPGIGRSFDCKIWPPPYEDDPDRRTSKF